MEYLIEAPQNLPIVGEYDVLVLGGGPAGVSAAVAASKAGAKVAIVERYGFLGGQATGGLVILLVGLTDGKEVIIKGICEETIGRLQKLNATKNIGPHILFDPESLKLVFDNMIEDYNITPFYHNFVSATITAEHQIVGVIVDGKSGRRVIRAKVYIDATGDADLAKYSNIPLYQNSNLLPVTLGFRVGGIDRDKVSKFILENDDRYKNMLQNLELPVDIGGWVETIHDNEAWFNIAHIENIDSTNSEDLTKAEIVGRNKIHKIMNVFKNNIPGFERGYVLDTASQIGVRDSRRIKGEYYFTRGDIGKKFEDSIGRAPNYTGPGYVEIPYRCLLTRKYKNIIFAGRSISVEHELFDMFREIPCCMATGQAAGIAAYIAGKYCENGVVDVHKINIETFRGILLNQNVVI